MKYVPIMRCPRCDHEELIAGWKAQQLILDFQRKVWYTCKLCGCGQHAAELLSFVKEEDYVSV